MAGTYDGSIRINTKVDTKSFNTGASSIVSGLKGIAKAAAIAFSTGAIIKFGAECVNLASDLAEVDNVVSKSFGSMRSEMDALANSAIKDLGMSRLTAYQTGSTFMAMGKSMLDSTEDAKTMALELTKLTGNMSSFYNKSQDLVSLALKSVYTGETETLKQYGIVMTEVNLKQFALEQGITKSYSAMTQSEKVMLRYKYVMQQTAFIGNDFIDTQNSWANQTRILKEQWKEFMTIVGNGLVTVLTPVVRMINTIVGALINFANTISSVLSSVFGIQMQSMSSGGSVAEDVAGGYSDATDSVNDYAGAVENASDANKEAEKTAEKSTASFDNLNKLNSPSSSATKGGGGSGGSGGGGINTGAIDTQSSMMEQAANKWEEQLNRIKEAWENLKKISKINFILTWEGLNVSGQLMNIKNNIDSIGNSLQDIFTDKDVTAAASGYVESLAQAFGVVSASIISIGASIGEAVTGGIATYLDNNSDRISGSLSNLFNIGTGLNEAISTMWATFASLFQTVGGTEMQSIIASFIQIITDVIGGTLTLVFSIATDLANAITGPIESNMEPLKTAISGTLDFISTILGTFAQFVRDAIDGIVGLYESHISPFITSVSDGISTIISAVLDGYNDNIKPVLDTVGKDVKKLYDEYVKPIMDNVIDIIGDVIDIIAALWKKWLAPVIAWCVKKIMPIIQPILTALWNAVGGENGAISKVLKVIKSITGVISTVTGLIKDIVNGDWEKVWNTARDVVKGVVNGIIGLFEGMVNKAIDAINFLLAPLRKLTALGATAMNAIFGTSFSVPEPFGHVTIPKLATGAVIPPNAPFLAMLGDQKNGTNIETPLDTMIQAFKTALNDGNYAGNKTATVIMQVDKQEFGRAVVKFGNKETQRVGISLV